MRAKKNHNEQTHAVGRSKATPLMRYVTSHV
jgi:hypothetical protein